MKPHRLRLTHHLILGYGLHNDMDCYRPHTADQGEMAKFHSDDYLRFLQKITPDNARQHAASVRRYGAGDTSDCPVFDGLYEFTQYTTGASLDGAIQLCLDEADITINWSGGFHHAKKASASGFCYVNGMWCNYLYLSLDGAFRK